MALRVTTHVDPDAIVASVQALTKNKVLVGIPDTTAGRNLAKGNNATGLALGSGTPNAMTNAAIGYVQNFGSPKQNIPAREFMQSGIMSAENPIVAAMKRVADYAMSGDRSSVIQGLHAVGLIAQNAIRRKITQGPFSPLSGATLAKRKKAGRKGERPLIDTGQLRRSITYVLRGKWF